MNRIWLVGKIHDKPKPRTQFLGPEITREEASRFFASLVNKPVFIEHNENIKVGKVLEVWESDTFGGQVLASLELDPELPGGLAAIIALKKGKLRGLSFAQFGDFNICTGERFSESTGIEISLVVEGAVPDSLILCWGDKNKITYSQFALRRLKMSSEDSQTKKRIRAAAEDITDEEILRLRADSEKLKALMQKEREADAHIIKKNMDIIKENPEIFGDIDTSQLNEGLKDAWEKNVPVLKDLVSVAASASSSFGKLKQNHTSLLAELEKAKKEIERLNNLVLPSNDLNKKEHRVNASASSVENPFEDNPLLKLRKSNVEFF